jgi:hypothetical protein
LRPRASSALHHAARQGNVGSRGADRWWRQRNLKTGDGNSPLLIAVINGEFDVAMMLVKAGANRIRLPTAAASPRSGRR